MHLGHDVDAVDDETGSRRHPQRGVQNRPVLGDVHVLAREHRVDPFPQTAFVREIEQQLEGLSVDPVFAVVEIPARDLDVHPVAIGLGREQLPHGAVAHELGMTSERVPAEVGHQLAPDRENSVGCRSKRAMPPHRQ